MLKRILLALLIPVSAFPYFYIPMDDSQQNHLKAYGLAYLCLQKGAEVKWLLNYCGGSFLLMSDDQNFEEWAILRNITIEKIGDAQWNRIQSTIESENMTVVRLDKAPKIAVYAPPWNAPWDDAVTLALDYAEIPFTRIWDEEVISGQLTTETYDWVHLHHEDFTGQHGKFWYAFANEKWYIERAMLFNQMATKLGFSSVQEEKKAVAWKIREYVESGGFLFAMCAAADSLDIALASVGIDIVPQEIDGTPFDNDAQSKLNYSVCFAFENFKLVTSPYIYEYSDIDVDSRTEGIEATPFYFKLVQFAAKYDVIPTMLNQNHRNVVKGFLGQTTGFKLNRIRKDITLLNTIENRDWVTYIHGDLGKGAFTFYGGHDPEDYTHRIGEPPTNLDLFPNSPGYRLILNNILFPASKEKKRKT